jgi:hypothetical protein
MSAVPHDQGISEAFHTDIQSPRRSRLCSNAVSRASSVARYLLRLWFEVGALPQAAAGEMSAGVRTIYFLIGRDMEERQKTGKNLGVGGIRSLEEGTKSGFPKKEKDGEDSNFQGLLESPGIRKEGKKG